ncbi:MAG: recombination protein RecR [Deltaproteobacteria bacterium]|nr:recombination protein RecR [Deltaproteobacteria bacterium]
MIPKPVIKEVPRNPSKNPIDQLIRALVRLPGVGERTATRLAFFILRSPGELSREIANAILSVREKVHFCERCQNFAEEKLCYLCRNPERDQAVVCVVEEPADLIALEKAGTYRGTYHILHGVIAPLEGVGPEQLKIDSLMKRVKGEAVKELILATNSNMEGEATALYLKDLLKNYPVAITRIASGVPVGGDLEFTDPMTLARALTSRQAYS